MQDLICQPYYSPPENITRNFVKLLAELIEDARGSFTIECPSIIVSNNDLLLALELPSIELVEFLVCFSFTRALLAYSR